MHSNQWLSRVVSRAGPVHQDHLSLIPLCDDINRPGPEQPCAGPWDTHIVRASIWPHFNVCYVYAPLPPPHV